MSSGTSLNTHVRWMIRRDAEEVLAIDRQSYKPSLNAKGLTNLLKSRRIIGMVLELDDIVAGFMIYDLRKTELDVVRMAVARQFRRQGLGSAMLDKLKGKLSINRRRKITVDTSDFNLPAHLFLKANQFTATHVIREWNDDGSDGYAFEFGLEVADEASA